MLLLVSSEQQALGQLIDGATLQGVGTMMLGVSSLFTIVGAIFLRSPILHAWRRFIDAMVSPRIVLRERAELAELRQAGVEERADAAEHTADNWKSAYDALDARITSQGLEIATLKLRNDALADYAEQLLFVAIQIEKVAVGQGVDLGELRIPPVPAIIADRLHIPETIR